MADLRLLPPREPLRVEITISQSVDPRFYVVELRHGTLAVTSAVEEVVLRDLRPTQEPKSESEARDGG